MSASGLTSIGLVSTYIVPREGLLEHIGRHASQPELRVGGIVSEEPDHSGSDFWNSALVFIIAGQENGEGFTQTALCGLDPPRRVAMSYTVSQFVKALKNR